MPTRAATPDPETSSQYTAGACKRCTARKRKCDRRQPRCTACEKADVACEVETRSKDKTIACELNELRARTVELTKETESLGQRVLWLESLLIRAGGRFREIKQIPTGHPIPDPSPTSSPSHAAFAGPPTPVSMHDLVFAGRDPSPSHFLSLSHAATLTDVPTREETLRIVNGYLKTHCLTHHVIDKEEIEEDVRLVYGPGGLSMRELSASRFRVFSVLYLEMVTVTSFDSCVVRTCRKLALAEFKHVIGGQDLLAVQSLVFLCRFAIREPGGPGLWQLVGIAARTAMIIRLHRRDPAYANGFFDPNDAGWKLNEKKKNIFWAVYSLDRLASFIISQPHSIRDADIDVDLPAEPFSVDDFAGRFDFGVSYTAIRVHSLGLRKLYGKIYDETQTLGAAANRPTQDCQPTIDRLVEEVHRWYQSSPLRGPLVPITESTINRQFLDDVSYQQMILALHRPSVLVPDIPPSFIRILRNAANSSIDLYRHYYARGEIPITWIHLFQIFTSCVTLVKCYGEYRARHGLAFEPYGEVETRLNQCRDLLARFGPKWPESQLYQAIFETQVASFVAGQTPRVQQAPLAAPIPLAMSMFTDPSAMLHPAVDMSFYELFGDLAQEAPGEHVEDASEDTTAPLLESPEALLRSLGFEV